MLFRVKSIHASLMGKLRILNNFKESIFWAPPSLWSPFSENFSLVPPSMGNAHSIIERRLSFGHLVEKLKKKISLLLHDERKSDENRRTVFVLFCFLLFYVLLWTEQFIEKYFRLHRLYFFYFCKIKYNYIYSTEAILSLRWQFY